MLINLQFECDEERLFTEFEYNGNLPIPNVDDNIYIGDRSYTVQTRAFTYLLYNDSTVKRVDVELQVTPNPNEA